MPRAVTIFTDSDDLAAHAADRIIQATQEPSGHAAAPCWPWRRFDPRAQTYSVLAQPGPPQPSDWAHAYLFFGDERFVRLG